MSLSENEVGIVNQAFARIGSKRITLAIQTSVEGVQANLHYAQTRNALLRSFVWPFASARDELEDDGTTPDFEWDYQCSLPSDFLRMVEVYGVNGTFLVTDRWAIEGDKLLINDDEADIKYIKKVTDPDDFDPLFTEVLVLQLALKLLPPLAGTNTPTLREGLLAELKTVMSQARLVCRQETNVSGRSDWNLARLRSKGT